MKNKQDVTKHAVLAFIIAQDGPPTHRQIWKHFGIGGSVTKRILNELVTDGELLPPDRTPGIKLSGRPTYNELAERVRELEGELAELPNNNLFDPKNNPADLTILLEAIQAAVNLGWIPSMDTDKKYLEYWAGMEKILSLNAFGSKGEG